MKTLLYLAILLSNVVFARDERFADIKSSFKHKEINGETLALNGIAVHRRFVFDIYRVALYIKNPTHNADEILNSNELKYAEMTFLRDIKASDLKDAFHDTYLENCLDKCDVLKNDIEKLIASIPNMQNGEVINFIFAPDQSTISGFGNTRITFEGAEFGHFFIRAWLGDTPPSQRFKRELLNL